MRKEDKAGFLFEELGNVDDSFLTESSDDALLRLRAKKSRARTLRRAILIAAAVTLLVAVVSIGAMSVRNRLNAPPDAGTQTTAATEEEPTNEEIETLTQEADLFDGSAAVYWTSEGRVCRRKIDGKTLNDLMALAKKGGESVSGGAKSRKKVWIADGRGGVYSPHLRWSAGSVGVGELYDYDQEIALGNELRRALYALTDENFNE